MAKTVKQSWYGIPCIIRHDYEDAEVSEKIQSYQLKSVKEFLHFCTNVPGFEYKSVLDVGCGDDFCVKMLRDDLTTINKRGFNTAVGIDLYVDEGEYDHVAKADWYTMATTTFKDIKFDGVFINHSLEHAENIYALMQQVSALQDKGGALFIAVPDGTTDFGCSITSSTTHFSCITEKFLNTTLQRFGYNVAIETREFRPGAKEIWAFAIKMVDSWPLE